MKLYKEEVTEFENLSEEGKLELIEQAKTFSFDELLSKNPKLLLALIRILQVVMAVPFIGKGWKLICLVFLTGLYNIADKNNIEVKK